MKATIEFDLDTELEDFRLACDASHLRNVIVELDNELRNKIKHENKLEYEPIRDLLHNLLGEYRLELY